MATTLKAGEPPEGLRYSITFRTIKASNRMPEHA
jgi:hypothetical protein